MKRSARARLLPFGFGLSGSKKAHLMNKLSRHETGFGSLAVTAGLCAGAVIAAQALRRQPRPERLRLSGKTVLITGGSRGLGLALAEEFGAYGARIAICARDTTEMEKARQKLASKRIEAHGFPADVTQPAQVNSLVQEVISRFGALDILINDAGAITVGPFASFTQTDFEEAMNLMFWAPVNVTRAVLPYMQKMHSGQIINIGSLGGRVSIPHLLPYCCAKFALIGFSTGLTTELKRDGIRVLTVVPGLMRTGSYLNAEFKGTPKNEFAWFGLLGNLPGFSVAADYAAAQIREAVQRGDSNCTISLPAKALIALEALAPDVNRSLLEFATNLLPDGQGTMRQSGKRLNPALGAVFQGLTSLGRMAAQRFNE